ncbi:hypothetical protein Tco_1546223 [Tanacetum coccineum]
MIPLSRGSFDVLVGMDRLSKRKFGIVCHEKVVRIPLEGDEILRVHGERAQGVVKTLMNTKVGESKLSDIPVVRDFIDVFLEDLSMTTTMTRRRSCMAKVTSVRLSSEGIGNSTFKHHLRYVYSKDWQGSKKYEWGAERKEAFQTLKNDLCDALINRMYVKDKILATSSETSKVVNAPAEMLRDLDQQMEKRADDGPFEILERFGPVAYRLRLSEELSGVHDMFHVSNLKKCLADASLHVPLDEIKVDKTLCFVEEPVGE